MEHDQFPEEVLAVKWDTTLEQKNTFLSEDYLRQNSVANKILNDTFTRAWSSDSDDDTRKKKNIGATQTTPEPRQGIKRSLLKLYKPFSAYPRTSHLTVNQHKLYLQLVKKFSSSGPVSMSKQDQEEFHQYQILQEKVTSEQVEYLDFLRNFAIANQSRYSSINPDIKQYINELWKVQLKNPLKYPRLYRPYRTIGLVSNDTKDLLDLIPLDDVLKKGRVHILNMSRKFLKVERNYSKFVRNHPIINQENDDKEITTTFNCPVSRDPNAEVIAKNMNVDFVLSSSSLKRICDNYPPFHKSWEIPVLVKELDVEENGFLAKKRVIFIDKALPRRRMSVVDKLALYHKIAIKTLLVRYYYGLQNNATLHGARLDEDHVQKNVGQDEDFPQMNWFGTNDIESLGVNELTCSKKTVEIHCSHVESVDPNEKSVMVMEVSDKICDQAEDNSLSEQNDNSDVNSVCLTDSEDDQLVIDDPEISSNTKIEPQSQNRLSSNSKNLIEKTSPIKKINCENKLSVEEKPCTRNMAKMLEALHKVAKLTSVKSQNSRENISSNKNAQLGTLGNSEEVGNEKTCSPNEEINDRQCDNKTSVSGSGSKVKGKPRSLLDDLLEQQKKWFEHERPKSDQYQSKTIGIKEKAFLKDYQPIPPPRGSNYVYRLFSLEKKGVPSPGYRLLIRCKTDAQEVPPKRKTATIVSKLEFQPEFGAEVVTVSEMIQDWLSLRIRPHSFLIRARINAFTSDVMMLEQKESKDFYKDEKFHNMAVSSCLHTLEAVLRAFCDLPPAQYIFMHEPKMGAFGNVYMATNDIRGTLYDLHEQYNVDTTADEPQILSSLWVPIDFSIITPLYEQLGRVPGTFTPKGMKTKKNKKTARNKLKS